MAHNTPEQNAAFGAAFDATNARYKAFDAYMKEQERKGNAQNIRIVKGLIVDLAEQNQPTEPAQVKP